MSIQLQELIDQFGSDRPVERQLPPHKVESPDDAADADADNVPSQWKVFQAQRQTTRETPRESILQLWVKTFAPNR